MTQLVECSSHCSKSICAFFTAHGHAENFPLQEHSSSEIGHLKSTPTYTFYYLYWEVFLKLIDYIYYKKSQQINSSRMEMTIKISDPISDLLLHNIIGMFRISRKTN